MAGCGLEDSRNSQYRSCGATTETVSTGVRARLGLQAEVQGSLQALRPRGSRETLPVLSALFGGGAFLSEGLWHRAGRGTALAPTGCEMQKGWLPLPSGQAGCPTSRLPAARYPPRLTGQEAPSRRAVERAAVTLF